MDEGIQTNPLVKERPADANKIFDDDSFVEQALNRVESQTSERFRLFGSVPTLLLEARPLHLAAR